MYYDTVNGRKAIIQSLRKHWGPRFESNFSRPYSHCRLQFDPITISTRRGIKASPGTSPRIAHVKQKGNQPFEGGGGGTYGNFTFDKIEILGLHQVFEGNSVRDAQKGEGEGGGESTSFFPFSLCPSPSTFDAYYAGPGLIHWSFWSRFIF